MASAADVLCAPGTLALLTTHPNTHALCPAFRIPSAPAAILRAAFTDEHPVPGLPAPLHAAIAHLRRLRRPRTPVSLDAPPLSIPDAHGMSPKKAHEVARMAAYVARLAAHLPARALRIVDVGAGQGYLTRALKARLPHAHVLALDADAAQVAGAQRYERRLIPHADPPIAHRTILIEPQALLDVVDEWVAEEDGDAADGRVPVLFVALHACGSLTPDVLRAFIASHSAPRARWYPAGVVAVGCCYNLMDPKDFPLSAAYRAHPALHALPASAFHLAAQVPATWVAARAPLALHPSAALAIRKVVWRALLERALQHAVPVDAPPPEPEPKPKNASATVPARWPRRPSQWAPDAAAAMGAAAPPSAAERFAPAADIDDDAPPAGTGRTPAMARLGRLRDAAYATWPAFLPAAAPRMAVVFPGGFGAYDGAQDSERAREAEEARRPVLDWAWASAPPDAGNADERGDGAALDEGPLDAALDEDPLDAALVGALPPALRPRARELAALHVLRCLVGALVEDALLADRAAWVRAGLAGDEGMGEEGAGDGAPGAMRVRLVNLFDQATGSGRNVALVVARALPHVA